MTYTIKRVNLSPRTENLLKWLDSECFPADEPYDFAKQDWWIVYDEQKHPVGYAGLKNKGGYVYFGRAGILPSARGHGLQRRLIRVREKHARQLGCKSAITDTVPSNVASNNNLIREGYEMYHPQAPWRVGGAIYWIKDLT